ncbi:LysM peptidoglycan-binding domain-containing protein [Variovorax sp. 160MFSha2.1]|uniref:LysM peptidoglycan-binding domain-containing protein n=1 Tax=Variovorax sp. 160MFSha2.1 TaxID=3158367 RepID=UPI003AAEC3C0
MMKDGTLSKVDSLTNAFNNFNPSAQDPAVVITRMISNYAYEWWDGAKQSSITLDPASTGYDPRRPQPPGYSAFGYDANGHLKTATDRNATTLRSFSYWTNAEGQVLQRQELIGGKIGADGNVSGASKSRDHRYFYFDGKRVGNVGNDGVEREDYAQQLARSAAAQSPDDKYRKFTPTNSADFDENYQPINAGFPGPAPGSYTVREGDTLEKIARSLWGDAQLWYLLAEANGLDGQPSAPLTPNTVLQVPNKVTNLHNTSSTFRPYDPGKAMGDTSPTLPDPLPAPRGKDGGCGGIGKILTVVVAVVVAAFTQQWYLVNVGGYSGIAAAASSGAWGTLAVSGAVGGVAGSVAGQAVGIATGVQDQFSWKGVVQGALQGGLSAGLGGWLQSGGLGSTLAASGNWGSAARHVASNIATQGLSIATGLQKGFDWRGVAASAASGYVSAWARPMLASTFGPVGGDIATRMASGIVSTAVRGGSVSRSLPGIIGDAVGSTVGNALGDSIAAANEQGGGMTRGEAEERTAAREVYAMGDGIPKVNGLDFSQDAAARRADINPAGLPTYVGSDAPAFAYDYRNGSDIASDNYNGGRRTATVRSGQGPLAALADLGLNSAQRQAGYGYLLKTRQVQVGRNGVPMVQPGQELHIDLDDTSQARLASRAISQESSMRAQRLADAAQTATDSANAAETRKLFNSSVSSPGYRKEDFSNEARGLIGNPSARTSSLDAAKSSIAIEKDFQSLMRSQPDSPEGWAARSNTLADLSTKYQNTMQSGGLTPDPTLLNTIGLQRAIADYRVTGDTSQLLLRSASAGIVLGMETGVGSGGSGGTPLFANQVPKSLASELSTASKLGVAPMSPVSPKFDAAINEGTIKYAVTPNGDLLVIPKYATNGTEISHAVITKGQPVIAAGEAEIAGNAKSGYIGMNINAHSGHYMNGNTAAQNAAVEGIAKNAFAKYGILGF